MYCRRIEFCKTDVVKCATPASYNVRLGKATGGLTLEWHLLACRATDGAFAQ